ncbi:MAG: glutaminase [Halieaceae bacterium]|jgi:glutaminase
MLKCTGKIKTLLLGCLALLLLGMAAPLHADVDHPFSIQFVAAPFTAALVMEAQVIDRIGLETTGMTFNSITAIEMSGKRLLNRLVNAGAVAAVTMVEAKDTDERGQIVYIA